MCYGVMLYLHGMMSPKLNSLAQADLASVISETTRVHTTPKLRPGSMGCLLVVLVISCFMTRITISSKINGFWFMHMSGWLLEFNGLFVSNPHVDV